MSLHSVARPDADLHPPTPIRAPPHLSLSLSTETVSIEVVWRLDAGSLMSLSCSHLYLMATQRMAPRMLVTMPVASSR